MQPPPWIFIIIAVPLVWSDEAGKSTTSPIDPMTSSEADNTTLNRPNRGASERDRRLVQYPTYYLAHSYTNNAGQRHNVLIPVQASPQSANYDSATHIQNNYVSSTPEPDHTPQYYPQLQQTHLSPSPQIQPNGVPPTPPSPQLARVVLMSLQNAAYIPQQQSPTRSPTPEYISGQPPGNAILIAYRPTATPTPHRYVPPQFKLVNSLSQPSKSYTGPKFQYNIPATKLYNLDGNNYHRFRPRPRPDKFKYTATKLQLVIPTTPSPYTNKVKFELEDARFPTGQSLALQPIMTHPSAAEYQYPQTTVQPFTEGASTTTAGEGLSQYLEPEKSKQHYFYQPQQVEYVQVPRKESTLHRPSASAKPHVEQQQIHYVHDTNELGPSSPSPPQQNIQYVQEDPREHNGQYQFQYQPVTEPNQLRPASHHYSTGDTAANQHYTIGQSQPPHDYSTGNSPAPQQYSPAPQKYSPAESPTPQHFSTSLISPTPQYYTPGEGSAAPQYSQGDGQSTRLYVPLPDNRQPARPTPQYQHAHENQPARPTPPQIEYVPITDIEGSGPTPEKPVEFVPQIESNSIRTPPKFPLDYPAVTETNEVQPTPQPHAQYISHPKDVTPTPQVELTFSEGKLPASLEDTYNILRQTNKLPANITPDNIDGSIKALSLILQGLQQQEKDHKYEEVSPAFVIKKPTQPPAYQKPDTAHREQSYPQASGTSTPGKPGVDYPTYSTIPRTSFNCATQRYKGFFGDPETHCQVWHYCDLNGGQASFLCPNGTIFNQVALTCDWWFNVRCSSTSQLYVLNERLYKYILPFNRSFPEDYSGPVVDRYLAAKFKEQEAKNRIKILKALISTPAPESVPSTTEVTTEAAT